MKLEERRTAVELPAERRASGPPTVAWVAFGVGALGAIASGVFAAMLVESQSTYRAGPTKAGRDDFYEKVLWTDIALGVTAAGIVTGIVAWIAHPTKKAGSPSIATRP